MEASAPARFPSITSPARVLLAGTSAQRLVGLARAIWPGGVEIEPIASARSALAHARESAVDLVVLDASSRPGRVERLVRAMRRTNPSIAIVLVAGEAEGTSLREAIRARADGVIEAETDAVEATALMEESLARALAGRLRAEKLAWLETVCRGLVQDREALSRRVGGLCGDIAQAHQQWEARESIAARVGEFRGLLSQEMEIDDVIRTAMQFLVGVLGTMNAAILVPTPGGPWRLAGYAKADLPRRRVASLITRLREGGCEQLSALPGAVRGGATLESLAADLPGQALLAFPCSHEGAAEAVVVCFRPAERPFEEWHVAAAEALRGQLAAALGRLTRIASRAGAPGW